MTAGKDIAVRPRSRLAEVVACAAVWAMAPGAVACSGGGESGAGDAAAEVGDAVPDGAARGNGGADGDVAAGDDGASADDPGPSAEAGAGGDGEIVGDEGEPESEEETSGTAPDGEVGADVELEVEAEVEPEGPVELCGEVFEVHPGCGVLEQKMYESEQGANVCEGDGDCLVGPDPTCGESCVPTAMGFSKIGDYTAFQCWLDAWKSAPCDPAACDWWGPTPEPLCAGGRCEWIDTSCSATGCEVGTWCDFLDSGECLSCAGIWADSYCPSTEACGSTSLVVTPSASDECAAEVVYEGQGGSTTVTVVAGGDPVALPEEGCFLVASIQVGTKASLKAYCGTCVDYYYESCPSP